MVHLFTVYLRVFHVSGGKRLGNRLDRCCFELPAQIWRSSEEVAHKKLER